MDYLVIAKTEDDEVLGCGEALQSGLQWTQCKYTNRSRGWQLP